VHHAQNERYIDRNYGGIFILWDRMFGSFQEELDSDPVVFGVRKPLANWNPFWANIQVYAYLWFDTVRTKRWRDKTGIWFRRTGWRPADVEAQYPKRPRDLAEFHKFDPDIGTAMRRYALLYAEQGASTVLVPCLLLWATLYTLGLFTEGRSYAVRFELLRLLMIVPLSVAAMMATSLIVETAREAWLIAGLYSLGSVVTLKIAAVNEHSQAEKVVSI
jgi:hypothetical protein